MVAPVENLTALRGTVTARHAHPRLPDWDVVTLSDMRAAAVPGKADLLSQHATGDLEVAVRRELLDDAAPGSELSCRARLTAAGAMCEPHPRPEHFAVSRRPPRR